MKQVLITSIIAIIISLICCGKNIANASIEKPEEGEKAKQERNDNLTAIEAEQRVRQYLESNGQYVSSIIEVDSEDNENYLVHCYDIVVDHTATSGWYYVNKKTGEITSMF